VQKSGRRPSISYKPSNLSGDTGKVILGRWEPGGEGINPWDVMRNMDRRKSEYRKTYQKGGVK